MMQLNGQIQMVMVMEITSSENATSPDFFPNNIAAANDSDGDGYPDIFTEYYNGSNAQGL